MNRRARARLGGAGAVAAAILLDLSVSHDSHGGFWWNAAPGFDLFFGFLGCVGLVRVAKALGRHWLQRPENEP